MHISELRCAYRLPAVMRIIWSEDVFTKLPSRLTASADKNNAVHMEIASYRFDRIAKNPIPIVAHGAASTPCSESSNVVLMVQQILFMVTLFTHSLFLLYRAHAK